MGRSAVPLQLKVIRGTVEQSRVNKREPKVAAGTPPQPKWLSRTARKHWAHIAEIITGLGVLTVADGIALESLVETYAELLTAREAIKERGGALSYAVTTQQGGTMYRAYPEVAVIADADRRIKGWLSEFGLTPATRHRVCADAPGADDPFAKF